MNTSVKAAKAALRKSMKQTLLAMSAESKSGQSSSVCKMLMETPEYVTAKSIACYVSMLDQEIDTDAVIRDALRFVPLGTNGTRDYKVATCFY